MELPRTLDVIDAGMAEGLHIGAQLHLMLRGQSIAEVAVGESRPGVAMETDTVMLWLSCTKAIVAAAVCQLWERDKFALDDPVATYIPEFAQNGKENITIRHILTHTAGFRSAPSGWPKAPQRDVVDRILAARLEPGWIVGRTAGYHAISSWFVLGELIKRLDGRPCETFIYEELFEPLGMHESWLAITAEQYEALGTRLGIMQNTDGGKMEPLNLDTLEACTNCRPSGSGHGPIRQLARFYQMMLNGGKLDGRRVLLPQTVEAMTARHRTGSYDKSFLHVVDWGLGIMINSFAYSAETPYQFGPYASPRTFGHGGFQSSVGCADPENKLVVAVVFNGCPGEAKHQQRVKALFTAIYEDLGLVPR
jgi:CubicO group peptidase (beta-lactamase class C family)